jgi:hypothetical protein
MAIATVRLTRPQRHAATHRDLAERIRRPPATAARCGQQFAGRHLAGTSAQFSPHGALSVLR